MPIDSSWVGPVVLTAIGLMAITIAVFRVRRLEPSGPATTSSDDAIAVIIPARNEAENLPGLLGDLSEQTLTPQQVIVIDDESDDDTAAIATAHGAHVIATGQRPDGWNPKVWALCRGVADAHAERLVFLDADVRLAPGALAALVAQAGFVGGLVSVAPYHCRIDPRSGAVSRLGAIESLSAPFNIVIPAGGGPGLSRSAPGAIGSCLTMTRRDYDHCGGHAATPNTIIDDLSLATTARGAGLAVTMLQADRAGLAKPLVAVRSYPGGFTDLTRGWTKNMSAGLGKTPLASSVGVALWVIALLLPLALALQGRWATALGLWTVVAVHTGWLTTRVGAYHRVVVTLGAPLLGLYFAFVSARSVIVRLARRPVAWKGRSLAPDGVERP